MNKVILVHKYRNDAPLGVPMIMTDKEYHDVKSNFDDHEYRYK